MNLQRIFAAVLILIASAGCMTTSSEPIPDTRSQVKADEPQIRRAIAAAIIRHRTYGYPAGLLTGVKPRRYVEALISGPHNRRGGLRGPNFGYCVTLRVEGRSDPLYAEVLAYPTSSGFSGRVGPGASELCSGTVFEEFKELKDINAADMRRVSLGGN